MRGVLATVSEHHKQMLCAETNEVKEENSKCIVADAAGGGVEDVDDLDDDLEELIRPVEPPEVREEVNFPSRVGTGEGEKRKFGSEEVKLEGLSEAQIRYLEKVKNYVVPVEPCMSRTGVYAGSQGGTMNVGLGGLGPEKKIVQVQETIDLTGDSDSSGAGGGRGVGVDAFSPRP